MEYKIHYKKYLTILSIIFLVCSIAIIWMIHNKLSYTPPPFEQNAIEGSPDLSQSEKNSLGYSPLTITSGISLYLSAKPVDKNDSLELYIHNPKYNSIWILCQVLDSNGEKISESGVIKQGYFIKELKKEKEIPDDLKLTIKIFCFEPYTYYSAAKTITFECEAVK